PHVFYHTQSEIRVVQVTAVCVVTTRCDTQRLHHLCCVCGACTRRQPRQSTRRDDGQPDAVAMFELAFCQHRYSFDGGVEGRRAVGASPELDGRIEYEPNHFALFEVELAY